MREQSVTAAKERLKCMIHYENNILDINIVLSAQYLF